MKTKLILLILVFMFIPNFAEIECLTSETYVGCSGSTVTSGSDDIPQFLCYENVNNIICTGENQENCEADCITYSVGSCSYFECSGDKEYRGTSVCGIFNTASSFSVHLVDTEFARTNNPCPYGEMVDFTVSYFCNDGGFFCFPWDHYAIITYTCSMISCVSPSTETVYCEKELKETQSCVDIGQTGLCTPDYQRCNGLQKEICNAEGQWRPTANLCNDFCCDINNRDAQFNECKLVYRSISNKYAFCGSYDDNEDQLECTPDGSFQCDDQQVQKCLNSEWINYGEPCRFPCNSTATANGDEINFCRTFNTQVGGCDSEFDTFCLKVGSDAFLYVCNFDDWVLTKECPSGRCNSEASSCYEGCDIYSERCYTENRTCYYCNIEGDWIENGVCQSEINNITLQCYTDITCNENALRCSIDWVIKCVKGMWVEKEKCSYACVEGQCITEEYDIITPLMDISDFNNDLGPIFLVFLLGLGGIGFIIFLFHKIIRSVGRG